MKGYIKVCGAVEIQRAVKYFLGMGGQKHCNIPANAMVVSCGYRSSISSLGFGTACDTGRYDRENMKDYTDECFFPIPAGPGIDPDFQSVKRDQYIFTIKSGWTKVRHNMNGLYPITTSSEGYAKSGRSLVSDIHPSAWTYNPFDPTDKPPADFSEGQIIAVRDFSDRAWVYKSFICMSHDGKYRCRAESVVQSLDSACNWRYARVLNDAEKGNIQHHSV